MLVVAATSLLALSPYSSAQSLYVANAGGNTIGEYNAATGATINAALVPLLAGVASPTGLAAFNNTLYVADSTSVKAFSVSTGRAAAGFNPIRSSGGNNPFGVLASNGLLYVSSLNSGSRNNNVTAYDTLTGQTVPTFAPITALENPAGLALMGTTLYVSNLGFGTISTYNALTGVQINSSLVSGLSNPNFLLAAGNVLYVSDASVGRVYAYNATTGAALSSFATITDARTPEGLALVNGNLLVSNANTNTLTVYNAATGLIVDANFISSGLNRPFGLALAVPEPSTWALLGMSAVGAASIVLRRRVLA